MYIYIINNLKQIAQYNARKQRIKSIFHSPPRLQLRVKFAIDYTFVDENQLREVIIVFDLIIIEDNSPDKTREIAHQLAKIYSNIVILERAGKQGLGSAYRDGIKKAKGNFVVIMDADLSHHPKYLPEMIKKQKQINADIVTGTRYVPGAGVEGWTFMRKLTSRVANFLASWTLGSNFSDLTGSYRVYKKEVLESLIAQVTTKGYSFQMEILIRAWRSEKTIIQQPIVFVDRIYGQSKLGPNQIFLYLKGMLQLFFEY